MSYPSLMRKVKCRFCGEELREKNYQIHLQRKHPSKNPTDKRSAGQTSIFAYTEKSVAVAENSVAVPENSAVVPENSVVATEILEDVSENTVEKEKVHSAKDDEKFDMILDHVRRLEQKLESMQSASKNEKSHVPSTKADVDVTDLSYIFQSCRSISDITSFFDEFVFNENDSTFRCRICVPDSTFLPERKGLNCHPSIFMYSVENGTDFPVGCNLTPKFRNLKRHLKDHLLSNLHKKSVESAEETEREKQKYARREIEVGMRIGRIAYRLYYKGRPYDDFEEEIALSIQNGCDMGEINHSVAFAKNFLPYVSNVVRNRLKTYINNPLIQTGFQPPLKIIADKATWKHRTRQFIMAVTIVPDSNQLIQALYLGHPVIKAHNGQAVADSIISCITEYGVTKSQFSGGSFDGQYFNLSVHEYLSKHFSEKKDKKYYYDWDPMHKAGLVDHHMRKNKKFSWTVTITDTITSIFGEFNYGKEYENLKDVCTQLSFGEPNEQHTTFKNPVFFSETRFANYCKMVYANFRDDFKAITTILEKRQVDSISGNSIQREKAANANIKMNKILNAKFCLRLSGLCDFYNHFSKIICDLQKVDVLPHERYSEFICKVEYLQSMSSACDVQNCPCSCSQGSMQDNCFWPMYHADCKALESDHTYQGVPIFLCESEDQTNSRSKSKKVKIDPSKNKIAIEKELIELSLYVVDNMKKVFTEEDIKLFEHVKVITDLKLLATKIKMKGVVLTAACEVEKFLFSAKTLVNEFENVPTSQLELQYRVFLEKLEELINHMPLNEYIELSSKSLIKTFLASKLSLFKGIELIIHTICVASTISSVESVCESLTSKYEHHNNKRRPITEETAEQEMMISNNGPLPTNCDAILSEAMNCYFAQKEWHFVRRSNRIKDWTISKCADKLINRISSLPFMDKN